MPRSRINEVETIETRKSALSRRHLLKAGSAAAISAGVAPSIIPGRARAQQKTLKILQWKHFVPSYDEWFNGTYVKKWGEVNDTKVVVDNIGLIEIDGRARAESEAQHGHDLVLFLTPAGMHEDHVVDHREIYQECEHRYGKVAEFCAKSTYNARTSKYFGFTPSYQPPVIIYRKDLWAAAGALPNSWADVLDGGRRIKLLHQKPVGFSLAPENNSDQTMRAIMYSFGSSEQDEQGNPALDSKETLEVIKYVKALYEEAMTEDVLTWDPSSNNRFMLEGEGCLTLDTVSVPRASESIRLPIAKDLWLSGAPEGPVAKLTPPFSYPTYLIWSFADNIDGAKQFLVDLIGHSRDAFLASGFQHTPAFPNTVPDLATLVANDAGASPPDKYALLAEVATWTTNVGHPGYTNPAISEIFQRGVLPTMFSRAATGQLTPEEALAQADSECRRIFQEWKERGKV